MAYQHQSYGGQPQDYNQQRPYGQGFQAQPNYSAAPVMRAGGGDDGGRRYDSRGPRAGLGADQGGRNIERDRQQVRENMMAQQPPTREEVARTIFIGGLGENAPADEAIEAILRCAGKLRRWIRAKDADDVKCRFGFAEYEDVDSLEAAKELFGEGIEAPAYKDGKIVMQEGEGAGPQMLRLLVVIDEQSSNYIDEWMSKRNEGEDAKQFRIDNANEDLRQCMASLLNGDAFMANGYDMGTEGIYNGAPAENGVNGEGLDDELADIPVEMRAIVAQEIKNFREQSTRRDRERIALEQESIKPMSRLESPGLHSTTNGSRPGVAGAPSGPKGDRGQENGAADVPPEDESDASDAELERRRKTRKEEDLEKRFEEAERRWYAREKARANAADRDRVRQEAETKERNRDRDNISRKLEEFDDDEEDKTGHEEYYYDRSAWARKRQARRQREAQEDELDRKIEERDNEAEQRRVAASRGAADRFLAETGAEMAARQKEEPAAAGFKISLGGAAARKSTAAPRRTIADMAGLLEEEEDAAAAGKPQREMRAIANASAFAAQANANMTDEEKAAARQALAADIPMEADRLFDRKVYWQHIGLELLEKEVRPFVERKVIEALGLQEDFLVELIMTGLKEHTTPPKLITDLEAVLDDESEGLVRKVWRLVVYLGEAKEGGLM